MPLLVPKLRVGIDIMIDPGIRGAFLVGPRARQLGKFDIHVDAFSNFVGAGSVCVDGAAGAGAGLRGGTRGPEAAQLVAKWGSEERFDECGENRATCCHDW